MISKTPTQVSESSDRPTGYVMLLLIVIMLLATGLRFYQLDAQSFWNDEGNSARLSERSLPLIIEGTASDVHPPLYYVLLRGWRELLGESEFGLRSFSAFAGILTVAATVSLARFFFPFLGQGITTGIVVLIAGVLAAMNPTLVYYSQETRMYALLALLASLSTLTLLRWLGAGRRWPWALAYVLLSTAGLYTHYFYPSVFVLHGLIVLAWLLRTYEIPATAPLQFASVPHWYRIPMRWLIMVGATLILYLPWAPVFLRQTSGRATERASIPDFIWSSVRWMTFGDTVAKQDLIWITVFVILLLVWAIVASGRRIAVASFGVFLLVAAMYLAGTTNPAFFKFMIIAIPFFLIWLAGSVGRYEPGRPADRVLLQIMAAVLLIPVFVGIALSLRNLYYDPTFARANYRGMASTIATAKDVDAGVILDAPNQWEVFTYYYKDDAAVYPLPKGQPDPAILEPELAEIAERHERLYVLYWGEEQRDPQRVVENWLDANTFKASESWVGDVRFVVYATSEGQDRQQTPLNISFGDKIELHSFAIAHDVFSPGDIIQISLRWSAKGSLDERYKVYLHLVDENGVIVAQQDSEPVGGMSPTSSWPVGDIIVDNQGVLLADDLSPGEYELLVGLYELDDPGERLNVQNLGNGRDHFALGTIVIE